MTTDKFNKTIDAIQAGLVWFVVGVITICIGVLFLFDVLAGTGTMLYLTDNKEWQSVVISVATTGLLFAIMLIGYMMVENRNKTVKSVGIVVLVIAGAVYLVDIVFDSLLADILRWGTIYLSEMVDPMQWLFRGLLGGISTIGDALAIAMILGMPVLKNIVKNAFGAEFRQSYQPRQQERRPAYNAEVMSRIKAEQARKEKETEDNDEDEDE